MATVTFRPAVIARCAAPVARRSVVKASLDIKKFAVAGAAALFLSVGAANAATVKMGADSGDLVFEPSTVSIKAGDSVTFVANAGFPHNVVFEEDSLSHEDAFNAKGESWTQKFAAPGTYDYECTLHGGMAGKVIVS